VYDQIVYIVKKGINIFLKRGFLREGHNIFLTPLAQMLLYAPGQNQGLLKAETDQIVYNFKNLIFSFVVSLQRALTHFYWRKNILILSELTATLNLETRPYLPYYISDKGF